MRHRLALAALVPFVVVLGGVSTAQAVPTSGAPNNAHGQCVSESAKAGQGGRSAAAREKGNCTPPLVCTENGNVELDSRRNTVTITGTGPYSEPDSVGSSLECGTDIDVEAGDEVSFTYELGEGTAPCGGGVPRIFVVVGGNNYNNTILDPTCADADGNTVTFTIPENGTVTQVGFVYDRGDTGSATFSKATVGGVTLNI